MNAQLSEFVQAWWGWTTSMTVQVAILVLVIATLDRVLRRWVWPQLLAALWALVILKLIMPPTLTSPVSIARPGTDAHLGAATPVAGADASIVPSALFCVWLAGVIASTISAVAICAIWLGSVSSAPAPQEQPSAEQIAEMMAKAKKFTQPGEKHKLLEKMIGKWTTETRFVMGGTRTKAEKGTSETSWLIKGRWVQSVAKGTMMGRPMESVSIFGHDNFKQSYVMSVVSSADTAMLHAEGDMDPGGKVLILYGTLDEYLTGEHDKMVKYVWRFKSDDHIVFEIHDLPIGEKNTQVIEIVYKRKS
jgi:hypothetical protein